MNKKLLFAFLLLAVFAGACYIMGRSFGWIGVISMVVVFVAICSLQFYRVFKLLSTIQNAPEGHTQNAQVLAKQIRPGMTLIKVVQRAGALGKKISDTPEIFAWQDSQHNIEVTLINQRVTDVQIKELSASSTASNAA